MKFAELYEVSADYIEELDEVTEYGGIADALDMLNGTRRRSNIYNDPLLAAWFKKNAADIARYAVREIRIGEPLGIRSEASLISGAGIELPDLTLTWHIRNMIPQLAISIEHLAERDPTGAANGMIGLKQYHDIDIKRYVKPETIIRIVTDCIIHKHIGAAIKTLKAVLDADDAATVAYLNAYRRDVVKALLADMRHGDEWELSVLKGTVQDLESIGINWSELKIISDSLAAR